MRTDMLVLLVILAAVLVSMPLYAVGAAKRPDPHEVADRGGFVLGGFVRGWFYWFVGPVERVAIGLRLSPTAFNILGAVFGVLGGGLFALGLLNPAGWAVLAGGAMDVLDGRIARARGIADERGAFLDSTLDRFAEVGALVGLTVLVRDSAWAVTSVGVALGGSLLVSYARARGESVGVVCKGGVMQRAERLLLVGFGGILDPAITGALGWEPRTFLLALVTLVALGTLGTAVYRTVWIAARLEEEGSR